jgi:hypothetical protein
MADPFNFESAHKLFADQFKADGADFLYRKSSKGAAIRVSAAERDRFVADYKRHYRWFFWGMMVAMLALVFGWAFLAANADDAANTGMMIVGVFVLMVPFMAGLMWIWGAPARALQRRAAAAPALSAKEARDLHFSKISYGQLGLGLVLIPLLLLRAWDGPGSFDGWGMVWPLLTGGLFVLIVVQAVRKYLHERR